MLNDHLIIIMVLTYANFSLCLGGGGPQSPAQISDARQCVFEKEREGVHERKWSKSERT